MTNDATTAAPIAAPEYVTFERTMRPRQGGPLHRWTIEHDSVATLGTSTTVFDVCWRCDGSGDYPSSAWNGICLSCNGHGVGKRLGDDFAQVRAIAVKREKSRVAAARRAEKKAFEKAWDDAHAWNDWRDGRADLIKELSSDEYKLFDAFGDQYGWRSGFLGDMAKRISDGQPLSDAQEAAVRRTLADRLARTERKQAAGHLGVVGQRVEVEVTVVSAKDFDSDYGTKYLVIMETADHQTLKTWNSGDFGWQAQLRLEDARKAAERAEENSHWIEPVTVTIKATVKDHGEYKGIPQTELTRVTAPAWKE